MRSPQALTEFADEPSVRGHLLSLFIPARLAAADPAGKGPTAGQTHAWLAVLAGYLRGNESRPPFHGRVLSSTDLVLHQLWPLAGNRPRVMDALVSLLTCVPGVAVFVAALSLALSQMEIADGRVSGRTVGALMFLVLPGLMAVGLLAEPFRDWREVWSTADEVGSRRVRGERDRRKAVVEGVLSAVSCFLMGVGVVLKFAIDLPLWMPVVFGLLMGIGTVNGESGESGHAGFRDGVDPRAGIRNDVVSTLVAVLAYGPGFGFMLAIWFPGLLEGLSIGTAVTAGAIFGMSMVASWSMPLSRRYLGLLLSTRGRLPWRLGRFLHRCYGAGLLRISGVAYQFRHRELQDYLAAHPMPSFPGPSPHGGNQYGYEKEHLVCVVRDDPLPAVGKPSDSDTPRRCQAVQRRSGMRSPPLAARWVGDEVGHATSSTASHGATARAVGVSPANVVTSRWRWDWST